MLLRKHTAGRLLLTCTFLISALCVFAQAQVGDRYKGKASYYSIGNRNADGSKFDKNALTCATHRDFPFCTKLRVTNPVNNKSIDVIVKDRLNPKNTKTMIDITYAGAEAIDMIKAGRLELEIEVLEIGSGETPCPAETLTSSASAKQAPAAPAEYATPAKATRPASAERAAAKPVALTAKGSAVTAAGAPILIAPKSGSAKSAAPVAYNFGAIEGPVAAAPKIYQAAGLYRIDVKKPAKQGFGVQIMTLANTDKMLQEVESLQTKFPGKILVGVEAAADGTNNYKIILGAYGDRAAATKAQKDAAKKGYGKCFIVDLKDL